MTKYVQLDYLESGWKQSYLLKRGRLGIAITRYPEGAQRRQALALLESQTPLKPLQMQEWLKQHLNPALSLRLDQAVRARRKRYFDREVLSQKKKSIDLTHNAWILLSQYKQRHQLPTLSDALLHLLKSHHSGTL